MYVNVAYNNAMADVNYRVDIKPRESTNNLPSLIPQTISATGMELDCQAKWSRLSRLTILNTPFPVVVPDPGRITIVS
jgi:hypothetical protein